MPLLNDATTVAVGDTRVDAVYHGDVKVWPPGPPPLTWTYVGDDVGDIDLALTQGNLLVTENSFGQFLIFSNLDLSGRNARDLGIPTGNPISGGPIQVRINGMEINVWRSDQNPGVARMTLYSKSGALGDGGAVKESIRQAGTATIEYPA